MPSQDNQQTASKTVLLLLAVGIGAIEYFIPRIPLFPWLKPGLANVVTMVWIIRYGTRDAIFFAFLRSWITAMFFGFSFLTLALSLSGAVCACVGMGVIWKLLGKRGILGTVGLGITGALFHNLGQITAVFFLLTGNYHIFYQTPFMLLASVVFGSLAGMFVPALMQAVEKGEHLSMPDLYSTGKPQKKTYPYLNTFLFTFCVALMITQVPALLIAAAAGISLWVQVIHLSARLLLRPVAKFWILFAFVGAMHLFFTYGRQVPWMPGITYEGIQRTLIQWLRIWSWIQAGYLLNHFNFHSLAFNKLSTWFKHRETTFMAGICAAEYFPVIISNVRKRITLLLRLLFSKPSAVIDLLLTDIYAVIRNK